MADFSVVNPATGETVREYPRISDADLGKAIAGAYRCSQEWIPSTTPRPSAPL